MSKMYKIKNRGAGSVVYSIPDDRIRRTFAPGEIKEIPFDEIQKLTYIPGGSNILAKYLQILDKEAVEELNVHVEPEYHYGEQDIIELIQKGSHDKFLDALDFAPEGVIDLIKKYAISLPMTDTVKIEALKEKTGFDVSKALENIKAEEEEAANPAFAASAPTRRVKANPVAEDSAKPARRYKVVNENPEE